MINYGKLLCDAEKDNPSKMLRATYLFSNVGDLVKCHGRMIRFPQDENLYKAEIKLALGDIMMQCRMSLHENKTTPINIKEMDMEDSILFELQNITKHAAQMLTGKECAMYATQILCACYALCVNFGWEPLEIEHLGYQHVMERFEQFARDGWR